MLSGQSQGSPNEHVPPDTDGYLVIRRTTYNIYINFHCVVMTNVSIILHESYSDSFFQPDSHGGAIHLHPHIIHDLAEVKGCTFLFHHSVSHLHTQSIYLNITIKMDRTGLGKENSTVRH